MVQSSLARPDPASVDPPAANSSGLVVVEMPREVDAELDPEWEEIFCWSYGPSRWNVGCG